MLIRKNLTSIVSRFIDVLQSVLFCEAVCLLLIMSSKLTVILSRHIFSSVCAVGMKRSEQFES